jgi:hypothetical protein
MDWPKLIPVVAFDPSPTRSYHAARVEGSESCGTVPSFVTGRRGPGFLASPILPLINRAATSNLADRASVRSVSLQAAQSLGGHLGLGRFL